MRYYIDTEFDGFGGPLISMALVREDGRSIHFIIEGAEEAATDPWVIENVLPILKACPEAPWVLTRLEAPAAIQHLLFGDPTPHVIADWPDDIRHFCDLVVLGPGVMLDIPSLRLEVIRVDAYPTTLDGAVQHNAWWDAVALKQKIEELEDAAALDQAQAFQNGGKVAG